MIEQAISTAAQIGRSTMALAAMTCLLATGTPAAADGPFDAGWTLDHDASRLTFQSVKNKSVIETSSFAVFTGAIADNGVATVQVALESVDTGIDLRNVRMRFLFFETFKFPQATITAYLTAEMLAGLAEKRRVQVPLPFTMDLHGVQKELQADVIVTLITDGLASVTSAAPIAIAANAFDLTEGVLKLQDAAKVEITPFGSVSFDFVFRRNGAAPTATAAVAATPPPKAAPPSPPQPAPQPASKSAALETAGDFSREACIGRFEILSRAGAIYFRSGSADLNPESDAILKAVLDIVERCPDLRITVAGHTDSVGGAAGNQRLSEARAASVAAYLVTNGVSATRVRATGFGEDRPVASNDTERGRRLNRRIEFAPEG